jgi:uncharacterized protein DUF397
LTDKSGLASVQDRDGWRKSSYSNSAGGSCVEIGYGLSAVFLRDSKDRRVGQPIIGLPSTGWGSFLNAITGPAR